MNKNDANNAPIMYITISTVITSYIAVLTYFPIQKCYVLLFQYIHVCFIVRIANHIAKIVAETLPPELSVETE